MVNIPPINRGSPAHARLKRQGHIKPQEVEEPTVYRARQSKDRRQRNLRVLLNRRKRNDRRNNADIDSEQGATSNNKGTNINTTA